MTNPKKRVIKAYRFDSNLVTKLGLAAKRVRMSENSFVESILADRVNVDPLLPAFQGIELSQGVFQSIVGVGQPTQLELAGYEEGRRAFALARELFGSNNIKLTFLGFLSIVLDAHSGWFTIEGEPSEAATKFTLRHTYGLKWSLFLKGYLSGTYQVLTKKELRFDISDDIVKLYLPGDWCGPR